MKNKSSKLNDIKKLKAQIDYLDTMLWDLNQFRETFGMEFPKNSFGLKEEFLIKEKIKKIEKEIDVLVGTFEKGTMLSIKKLSKVVLETWGKAKIKTNEIKWDSKFDENNVDNLEDDFDGAQKIFKTASGITFKKDELVIVEYTLNPNKNRGNDLYAVIVYLAPGMSFASLCTGEDSWSCDVANNQEFLDNLKIQIESSWD